MDKQTFILNFSGTVILSIDDAVISAVDDEWRATFYLLETPEEIAEHLAYNAVANHANLSSLDGWADQPDKNMVAQIEWDEFEVQRQRA